MKKSVQILLFLMATMFSLLVVAKEPMDREFKPWHKRISGVGKCVKCHEQEKPTKVAGDFKCESCHDSIEDMVKETAALGARNPHTSIHFGTTLPCVECHKEHSEPYNYCTEACHRTWPNNIPGKGGKQ